MGSALEVYAARPQESAEMALGSELGFCFCGTGV
jgi:hypothetical protein